VQMPRDDVAIAAVVAAAADDGDALAPHVLLSHAFNVRSGGFRDTPAGVFHQHQAGDAQRFNGVTIEGSHLFAGERVHACIVGPHLPQTGMK